MQTQRFALTVALACALAFPVATYAQAAAQSAPQKRLSPDEVKSLAAIQAQLITVLDAMDRELSQQKNKKDETQAELRDKLRMQYDGILKKNSLSDSAFQRRRFMVSSDLESRKIFDSTLAAIKGEALAGTPKTVTGPVIAVPATASGVHIGHVVNSFADTPDKVGLLTIAKSEQQVAVQHAALAMRAPTNLAMLQLHAGHIINALDPTIVTAGPGKQYGVKKAATNIATHIELAGAAAGATPGEIMHSKHIATAARSTVARADQIIALAQKVQAATDAAAAAQLMSQIQILCDQLQTGADMNSDGRVTFDAPEAGLQQVQEHVTLMLAPAKP